MNVWDLQAEFQAAGIKSHAYDIEGSSKDEAYCIDKVAGGWSVYYRERGLHRDERVFTSEDEACRHLHGLVMKDPLTRR